MPKPKIGILGMGSIGTRHYDNFRKLGCAVASYDPAFPGSSRQSIIDWADAIIIATPTSGHYQDIISCYKVRKPLLVEKPIISQRCNPLMGPQFEYVKMVGYNLRFHSCVIQAKKWLDAGFLGKSLWARFVCAQYNDKPQYKRDGVILNWSHEIDLACHLVGEAVVIACLDQNAGSEACIDMVMQHGNFCQTVIHLDYLTHPERRGFEIICENGSIEADLVARTVLTKGGQACDVLFRGKDNFDENYLIEAQAFLDRLDGKETLGCTAQEALDVVDICLTAKEMIK